MNTLDSNQTSQNNLTAYKFKDNDLEFSYIILGLPLDKCYQVSLRKMLSSEEYFQIHMVGLDN